MNVRNRKLQTPLHLAVQQAHMGLVPLLTDAGCSINAEDEEGDTALHVALQRHQLLPLAADRAGGDSGPAQLLSRVRKWGSGYGAVRVREKLDSTPCATIHLSSLELLGAGWGVCSKCHLGPQLPDRGQEPQVCP